MEEKEKKEKTPRQPMPEQEPKVRIKNYKEVPFGYSPDTAMLEASRCIQCKNPGCRTGCPVEIDIPAFINRIREGDFQGAIAKIKEKNLLPAVCGRVCPQELQCEKSCILGKKGEPVAIGRLERFVADWERAQAKEATPEIGTSDEELQVKEPPTGKRVAVVGSGPSGLTVAGDLILKGHDVTVFEAFQVPGGVLVYGIPEFRLPKVIVAAEVDYMKKLGVKFECDTVVGATVNVDELFDQGYDAVYVGVGAGLPVFMNIPGENLIGVYSANEYLTRSNLMKAYLFPEYDTPIIRGRDVVVFGAGNVAMDSARTALRLGADKVRIIYRRSRQEMPARIEEIHHAEEEGVEFLLLAAPLNFIGDDGGRLAGVRCQRMELGEPDESGRRRPVPIKNSEFEVACDTAVVAIGAGANPLLTKATPEIELTRRGYIVAEPETGKTTKKGVWAGGDIVTGQATVILAMGAGRQVANSIHSFLTLGW
ncbi:MAG: NADPH-dependent glutamate synthase [Deltaproteobacteria bacterium]|nr:NADPH-dependent glutamate synthase [Deltaproteobacteria bacterium]MBW2077489.1 NADPH-dependent glutamate synthase [Deltaproteobacteria bacterium]